MCMKSEVVTTEFGDCARCACGRSREIAGDCARCACGRACEMCMKSEVVTTEFKSKHVSGGSRGAHLDDREALAQRQSPRHAFS